MTNRNTKASGTRQFIIGMIVYVVVIVLESLLIDRDTLSVPMGIVFSLIPMLVIIWAMGGSLRVARTMDELQHRIFGEAALIAGGVTAVVTFTYGFLELLVGVPRVSMFVVLPLLSTVFALALAFTTKRYG